MRALNPAFICHEYFWDCFVKIFVSFILSFNLRIIYFTREKKSAFEKKISFEVLNYFVHTKFKFGLRSAWCGCKYSHYFIVHMQLVIYNYCPTLFLGYNFWYKCNFLGAQVIFPTLIFKQKHVYVSLRRSCLD